MDAMKKVITEFGSLWLLGLFISFLFYGGLIVVIALVIKYIILGG